MKARADREQFESGRIQVDNGPPEFATPSKKRISRKVSFVLCLTTFNVPKVFLIAFCTSSQVVNGNCIGAELICRPRESFSLSDKGKTTHVFLDGLVGEAGFTFKRRYNQVALR